MTQNITLSVDRVLQGNKKPVAVILAGHNGSGKSTLWHKHLSNHIKIPLLNADRVMMSVLPDPNRRAGLPSWAINLRDNELVWMRVAQSGVTGIMQSAMDQYVPFAIETVFSHRKPKGDGTFETKIDLIRALQAKGYYVLLLFVGLSSVNLSIGRVYTRMAEGGHAVPPDRLISRFAKTQQCVREALDVADGAILYDNSRGPRSAYTIVHIRRQNEVHYDIRAVKSNVPKPITAWLEVVVPMLSLF